MMEAKFRTDKLQNGNCDTADNFVSPNTADFKTQTSHTLRFKNTATPQAEILFTALPHEKMPNTANPQCPPSKNYGIGILGHVTLWSLSDKSDS